MKPAILRSTAAVGCIMSLVALTPARTAPEDPLLPDLTVNVPLLAEQSAVIRENGRRMLRFPTAFINQGDGPLEIRGFRRTTRDPFQAIQAIYRENGSVQLVPFGEFVYHKKHNHWHLVNSADYRLLDSNGSEVGASEKVSFCFADTQRVLPDLPNSPRREQYSLGDCPRSRNAKRATTGISVGWQDKYHRLLPGQGIDVTGLPPGNYELVVDVNPGRIITEKNLNNNQGSAIITLR